MRILIVEDDEAIARSLKLLLSRSGHAVDCLADGAAGERRIMTRHGDYDFLILDLMLPGKGGVEICRSLRMAGVAIPILILTGLNDTKDKVSALDGGADDYLVKPFSAEELMARIRALQRRPAEAFVERIRVGDLILDPATREVRRGDRNVALTLKEFELLHYLMRHPGKVMDREEIFAHLWDFSENSLSNVIDAHMKNLRKKIDDGAEEKLFETVRGVGYRIKAN
ncbi:MAG TPA: response regulator transcription factor [Candidatus Paceibacterota bacterium]|nr:response regulator transcription factor [Candidatus Paceibacterota bacterium]